jgi:hypothetical protein
MNTLNIEKLDNIPQDGYFSVIDILISRSDREVGGFSRYIPSRRSRSPSLRGSPPPVVESVQNIPAVLSEDEASSASDIAGNFERNICFSK